MAIKSFIIAPVLSLVALTAFAGNYDYETYSDDYSDSYTEGYAEAPLQIAAMTKKIVTKVHTDMGDVYANSDGMTLYTFTKDTASSSNCYDGCAASWPPFHAKKDAKEWGEFTVISRTDGTYQWAYQEAPLYFWVGDQKKGDVNGHGIKNVWYVAAPKAAY